MGLIKRFGISAVTIGILFTIAFIVVLMRVLANDYVMWAFILLGFIILISVLMKDPDKDLQQREVRSRYVSDYVKQEILRRQAGTCAFCPETRNLIFHHKEHYSQGGENTAENLVALCPNHSALAHSKEVKVNYREVNY